MQSVSRQEMELQFIDNHWQEVNLYSLTLKKHDSEFVMSEEMHVSFKLAWFETDRRPIAALEAVKVLQRCTTVR